MTNQGGGDRATQFKIVLKRLLARNIEQFMLCSPDLMEAPTYVVDAQT